jgi:hypothetical protein
MGAAVQQRQRADREQQPPTDRPVGIDLHASSQADAGQGGTVSRVALDRARLPIVDAFLPAPTFVVCGAGRRCSADRGRGGGHGAEVSSG